ncbi:MAG: DUF1080 domain-containing protein [Bacteroidota bacterium]|nr:DUF1080 domain-containing protein [Bacteroidota bacterium]
MKLYHLFILAIVLLSCQSKRDKTSEQEWIQLFNGKDLSEWDIKISGFELNDNYKNTFRVEDGLLKVRYDEYEKFDGEFGHIFYKQKFSHYKLHIEYRIIGEQVPGGPGWAFKNNGAMLHSQSARSMDLDQDFPVSIEAQFLGGLGEGERPTANLCTPGTHVVINDELVTRHCISSSSKTYHGEEWINVDFIVMGDEIIYHLVNGDTVLRYSKPQIGGGNKPENYPLADGTPLTEGFIALQAESHPFDFRLVELLDLSKK